MYSLTSGFWFGFVLFFYMMVLFCSDNFLLLLIHTLKNYIQTLSLHLNQWQIFLLALEKCGNTPSTFTHSPSCWPAHFYGWLLFVSAAAFLRLTNQPELVLPLPVTYGPSSLHRFLGLPPASTSHCFSSKCHPAFLGTALRHGRSAQGRGSTSFVRMVE